MTANTQSETRSPLFLVNPDDVYAYVGWQVGSDEIEITLQFVGGEVTDVLSKEEACQLVERLSSR